MKKFLGGAAIVLLSGASAAADPAQDDQALRFGAPGYVVTEWLSIPSADELRAAFPSRAARMGVSGQAVLDCIISPAGDATRCKVVSEKPQGYGFGDAALSLSGKFKFRSNTSQAIPAVGVHVSIPINFPSVRG